MGHTRSPMTIRRFAPKTAGTQVRGYILDQQTPFYIKNIVVKKNFPNQMGRLLVHIHGDGAALLLQGSAQGGGEGERQGVQRVAALSCQLPWHHLHDGGGASQSLLRASSIRKSTQCGLHTSVKQKIINFQITATNSQKICS